MRKTPQLFRREEEDVPREAFLLVYEKAVLHALKRQGILNQEQLENCERYIERECCTSSKPLQKGVE